MKSYKDLTVWQKAIELAITVYALTDKFPREEQYGLSIQMRRAAVSIASNIAEGRSRGTRKDFAQFLRIALGSGAELTTQVEITKRLPQMREIDFGRIDSLLKQIMKMLHALIKNLTART
ncbi:four helix bundle protein [Candidatus Parcubacteria bacterium]|nr:four helix bundle protein [Candidatus Parcubacteria bacterium]